MSTEIDNYRAAYIKRLKRISPGQPQRWYEYQAGQNVIIKNNHDVSNELKCTDGKWVINDSEGFQIETDNRIICDIRGAKSFQEIKANAHLIAASKDLYNSLVDMVEGFWWDSENEVRDKFRQENPGHPIIKAEAAIIKANSEYKPL